MTNVDLTYRHLKNTFQLSFLTNNKVPCVSKVILKIKRLKLMVKVLKLAVKEKKGIHSAKNEKEHIGAIN
jgi:hypothetical protein